MEVKYWRVARQDKKLVQPHCGRKKRSLLKKKIFVADDMANYSLPWDQKLYLQRQRTLGFLFS